jgi:DNA-binding FadR family transcriptional regulator
VSREAELLELVLERHEALVAAIEKGDAPSAR